MNLIKFSILALIIFKATLLFGQASKELVSVSKKGKVEFSPTISADGTVMIFETQEDDKWELFESTLTDGKWSEPFRLKSINDKCNFIAGPSLSYDGNTLYYTAFIEGVTKSEDIFYSTRITGNEWSEPIRLGAPINTDDGYEGFPSISSDGNTLYFIRVNEDNPYDKKAKENCFSIYVSHKKGGQWSEPVALPAEINSGCVRDPKIMADNHTLIFSSIRAGGKGKYDLYQSRRKPDGSWEPAVSLDFVNSEENDQSPCISASGVTMFFFSDNDIYQIDIPTQYRQLINITLEGITMGGELPIDANIEVNSGEAETSFTTTSGGEDGKYSLILAAGKKYNITFSHPQYVSKTIALDYSNQQSYLETKLDITLEEDWTADLSIKDKDLNFPLTAYVKLSEKDGAVLFQDSIRSTAYPNRFTLKTNKSYLLNLSAPGYTVLEKTILFPAGSATNIVLNELLEYEKVQMQAEVMDIRSGEKKRMKVTYQNLDKDEVIVADAGDVVSLRKGDRYQIMSNSEQGYAYSMQSVVAGETKKLELPVTSMEAGAKLTLNFINFEFNSANLSKSSALELDRVVDLLKRNPKTVIEISAHTDDVGSDEYNLSLSEKRAASVAEYLYQKGITKAQITTKGYGKSQPLFANDSDEHRAKNRRVELLVVK